MTPETILIFGMSIILLYIKPGPNQAMKITRALNDGFLPAWFFTLGATSIVIFYFILAGVSATVAHILTDTVGFYFKIIGGLFLFYLGYKGILNLERGVWKKPVDRGNKKAFVENYTLGVVMTLANPITIFYFVGIVPNFIALGTLEFQDLLIGAIIIFCVGNLADTILIGLVTQVKEALSNPIIVKNINLFSSIGFIALGTFFFYSAFFLDEFNYSL